MTFSSSLPAPRAVLFDLDGTLADTAPDLAAAVVRAAATLAKPGGRVFFSTLNRNVKSYLFAVVGAE